MRDVVQQLLADYDSRKLAGDVAAFEPQWTLTPYDLLRDYIADPESVDTEEVAIAVKALQARGVVSSFLGGRYIHDGYKIGTTSWIFMGRHEPATQPKGHVLGNSVYAISRTVPPDALAEMRTLGFRGVDSAPTWWMAYSTVIPIDMRCIGPCERLMDIMSWLPTEFPADYIEQDVMILRSQYD